MNQLTCLFLGVTFLVAPNFAFATGKLQGVKLHSCTEKKECLYIEAPFAKVSGLSPIYYMKNMTVKKMTSKNQLEVVVSSIDGYVDMKFGQVVLFERKDGKIVREKVFDLDSGSYGEYQWQK